MHLRILLPFEVFLEKDGVSRMVVETLDGSLGLLPRRLDCVAALAPGILVFETDADGEVYVAVDEGVLAKSGQQVLVSVRHAVSGTELRQLRDLVTAQFLVLGEQEKEVRSAMTKLETGFVSRFASFQHE